MVVVRTIKGANKQRVATTFNILTHFKGLIHDKIRLDEKCNLHVRVEFGDMTSEFLCLLILEHK